VKIPLKSRNIEKKYAACKCKDRGRAYFKWKVVSVNIYDGFCMAILIKQMMTSNK
jgi:hypothetical protein